ncbi:MAG TPA: NHLP leader peptide family RiPP precursor [Chloroflexota bacterium]
MAAVQSSSKSIQQLSSKTIQKEDNMVQEQAQHTQEYVRKFGQLVAQTWSDPDLKQRLLANPNAVLQEQGIELPAGKELKVYVDIPGVDYLPLPPKAQVEQLDEALAKAPDEQAKRYRQIVDKASADPAFKQRLLASPNGVLQEQGIQVPAGKELKVIDLADNQICFILPPNPAEGQLTDEQLAAVSGGSVGGALAIYGGIAGTCCLICAALL